MGFGVYVAATAAVQEVMGGGKGGEPQTRLAHPPDEGMGIGRKFMVGRVNELAVAIVVGHAAYPDKGQCVNHFATEGVDPGP